VFELCEFLGDVLQVEGIEGSFPHRVGLHASCHGLRGLRLGPASELGGTGPDKVRHLLRSLAGIELADLERPDECCGFGGTFAVEEAAMSREMGLDRLADHRRAGVEVITSVDMSCLMHLQGLALRHDQPVRLMHVAEILAEAVPGEGSG
jgi:L-lactate dehydrogenase complex protein LldE